MDKYDITSLSHEEVEQLQVDQALRIMGLIDRALTELNKEMYQANAEYCVFD